MVYVDTSLLVARFTNVATASFFSQLPMRGGNILII